MKHLRVDPDALHRRPSVWLAVLALVCALEVVTHTGQHSGFLASSRPANGPNDYLPADGYVSWAGDVPILQDATNFLNLTAVFLGQRGPEATGILDRRAAYAYLSSLAVPWTGDYAGFMVVNWLSWWAAAASTFWLVRRRWGDGRLALAASALVATGNGFVFMAGEPMSYVAAYAAIALVLALGERLGAFQPSARLSSWLLLGWAGGVASLTYFSHIPLILFWWIYGARRVPWRLIAAATLVALAISAAWDVWGRGLVGLGFATDNSALVGESVAAWLRTIQMPWPEALVHLRGGPVTSRAAIRGTLVGAFPYPWWLLAAVGFVASPPADRGWGTALAVAAIAPTLMILALFPLPRLAYFMYPAMYLMAARGALSARRLPLPAPVNTSAAIAALAALVLCSNLDLVGYQAFITRFHESSGAAW